MALTLDATLATAQDSQSRRPLVEIISVQLESDIPFDGNTLTTGTNHLEPDAITHSSNRILTSYIAADKLNYVYTDEERIEFTTVVFDIGTGTLRYTAMTELVNGDVGILYIYDLSGITYWRYKTLSVTGTQIADGLISSWSSSLWLEGFDVIKLANDTYLAVITGFDDPDYLFYKRTSSDFTSWSTSSTLSIGGIITTYESRNPSLLQIDTGSIFLWFDHLDNLGPNDEELINIYYSISSNNGFTWVDAIKVTSYDDYTAIGKHPVAVQKATDTMTMVFYEQKGALWMGKEAIISFDDSIWNHITDMHFNPVDRKLYFIVGYGLVGSMVKIDVDAWTVDNEWDCSTVPALNAKYCNDTIAGQWQGDGDYMLVGSPGFHCAVINGESDTITEYNFVDNVTWSLTKNVDWTEHKSNEILLAGLIDAANDKIWLIFGTGYLYSTNHHIGYILLSDTGPTYTFTTVYTSSLHSEGLNYQYWYYKDMFIAEDVNLGFYASGSGNGYFHLRIFLLSDSSTYKTYTWVSYPTLPYSFFKAFTYTNGKVYGIFSYSGIPSEEDKRGLCEITLATDTVKYYRPTYATLDDYNFNDIIATDGGKLIISTTTHGVVIFDPVDTSWEVYNNETLPGMTPAGTDTFYRLAYDAVNDMVFAGTQIGPSWWDGLVGFLEDGFIQQAQYLTGEYTTSWTFDSTSSDLVIGLREYEAAITLDPDNAMYSFWINEDTGGTSIRWDKEAADLNMSDFLTNDEISVHWDIDGRPNSLDFTVSHGHLFDPYNINSLYSIYLGKGRGVTLKFGETVNGTDYWQTQGEFVIIQSNMGYSKGVYPTMNIAAEDARHLWDQHNIVATEYYEVKPDVVIDDILTTHMGMLSEDIDLPTFDDEFDIEHQWLDTSVNEIVTSIANRFKYFLHVDVDGLITARKITIDATVDHTYTDNSKIFKYTPDDSFSSFVNRIVVTGQERDYIAVIFNEELIDKQTGTIGWWGFNKDFDIYYSNDLSKKCVNPRLHWVDNIHPAHDVLAWYGRVEAGISYIDPDDFYCTVEIDAPNLLPAFLAALTGYFFAGKIGDIAPPWGGETIPLGRWLENGFLLTAFYILGSITNYQFEVHAQPKGNIMRSVEGQADDLELQNKVGVIEERIDGTPFCYSIQECQKVAAFELLIEQLQRSRMKFDKVTHLQDEIGDTLIFKHPYTGGDLKCFVTGLTRKFKKSDTPDGDGYFIDNIEAWKL